MSIKWIRYKRSNPCPVCAGSKECRGFQRDDGKLQVHCRGKVAAPAGWGFLGDDRHGFAKFVEGWDDRRERDWDAIARQRAEREARETQERAARSTPADRDRAYRAIQPTQRLSTAHRKELHRRGLDDAQIALVENLGWLRAWRSRLRWDAPANIPGAARGQTTGTEGMAIALPDINGAIAGFQIKPETPREDGAKYVWLAGCQLPNGEMPLGIYQHPDRPRDIRPRVWVTEGTLKPMGTALKAWAAGHLDVIVFGVGGCNWASSPEQLKGAIAQLDPSEIILLPDAGWTKNENVQRQVSALAALVPALTVADWGQWERAKADHLDPDEIPTEAILGAAKRAIAPTITHLPQSKAERRERTLARARAIRASARAIAWHLETSGRYIPPLAPPPPEHGGRDLDAAMGTGKTHAIARDIAPRMFTIVLAPRNALGKQTAARCNFPHIHDYQPSQGEILALDAISRGGIIACAQSIERVQGTIKALGDRPYQVVIDEPTEVAGEILGGQTIKNRYSPIVAGVFEVLRGAQSVDIAQADLDAPTIDLVEDITGRSRYRHRHNSPDNPPWDVTLWNGPASGWRAALLNAIEAGQRIHLATTSKDEAQRLALYCEDMGTPYLKVDGDTDPQAIAEFCENPDGTIARERPQVLITTPTISSGSSIEIRGYFDAVYVYGPGLDPAVPAQMAGRIREAIPRHVWLPAFIKPEPWEKPGRDDGQRARARVLKHWGDDARRDRGHDQRIINSYLDRRRALAWARKVAPHEAITEILEAQGHRVTAITCGGDKPTAKIWAEYREALARRRAKERAIALPSNRQNIEWAKGLDNRESTYEQRVIADKVRAGDALPGMDWDDPETWYQVHFKPRETRQRAAKAIAWVDCEPEPLAYRMGGERQWVTGELSQPLIAPHLLPTRSRELAIMAQFKPHIAALLERGEARPGDPEIAAIAATARPMADEIRAVMDLTIDSNTSDMAIARKLFRRFGIDTERKSYLRGADGGRSWTLKLTTGEYWNAVAEARRRYWDAVILSAQGIQADDQVVTVSLDEGNQENCNHPPEAPPEPEPPPAPLKGQTIDFWNGLTGQWDRGRVVHEGAQTVGVEPLATFGILWVPIGAIGAIAS